MGIRPALLVDTNIILESVRVGTWKRLRSHEAVVTVRRCCEEAMSGVPGSPGRIPVSEDELGDPLSVVEVTDGERALLLLSCAAAGALDDGERDLLAHALSRAGSSNPGGHFVIVCADQAAVRAAISMGLGAKVVALEDVLRDAGVTAERELKAHYTRTSLSKWKTAHALGM